MSRSSVLIRCVLSISLMLNGLGTGAAAHGGARHASAAGQHHESDYPTASTVDSATGVAPGDASASKSPCHRGDAMPAAGDSQPADDRNSASTDEGDSLPECCRHAGCAGGCLQHSPAAPVLGIPIAIVTPPSVASEASTPHVLPERPPLTRPPDA